MGPKDTVDGTVNVIGPGTRGQPNGEADVGVSQGSAPRSMMGWLVEPGPRGRTPPIESTPRGPGSP